MSQEPQDHSNKVPPENATFDLPIRLSRTAQESQRCSDEPYPENTSRDSPATNPSIPEESQEDSSEIPPGNFILHIPTLLFGGDVAFLEELENEQSRLEMNPVTPVPDNPSDPDYNLAEKAVATESAEERNLPPRHGRRREAILLPQGQLGALIREALDDEEADDDAYSNELYQGALWGSIDGTGEYVVTGARFRKSKQDK